MAAIEVRDLHKRYGDNHAVQGLSFHVEVGEVYALLGPNGAGKSTVVEILEGHRAATSGEVSVLGFDPAKADRDFRDRIGVVLQSSGVENEFTVREVIDLYASAYRTRRSMDDVLALTGLEAKADERVGSLSGDSGVASTSRWASSGTPICCSSTSRRPGSIPRHGACRGI